MGRNLVFGTTDIRVIPEVMDMIQKSRVEGIDLNEMELFIKKNILNSDTKLLVAFDGNKINGFTLAYIVYPFIQPEIFIAWAYCDPREKDIGLKLLSSVEEWARSLGITRICAMVRKDLKAYQGKYGFVLDSYNVHKDLKLEVKK